MLSKRSNRGRGLSPSKYSRHSVPFMHAMTLGTSGAALVSLLWDGNLAIWRWQLSTKSWRIQDKLWPMFNWCGHSTAFLQFKHADLGNSENPKWTTYGLVMLKLALADDPNSWVFQRVEIHGLPLLPPSCLKPQGSKIDRITSSSFQQNPGWVWPAIQIDK